MRMFGNNSKITINGKTYSGNNITINNNSIIIDGKLQDLDSDFNKMEVSILCNVDKIISEESIYIKGDVFGNIEARNSVSCDKVSGNVNAGTSVNCDDIEGNASAGTVINCDMIKGNAKANIINR